MRPGRLIVLVFLFIILLGAGLLCLPAASRSGEATPFLTSLFTATSATCVTGLIRVDTGTHWAMFGQVVILLLIQVGGLGFMTIACLFFFALRRKIGLRERMVLAQALGSDSYSGIVSLVRNILRGTAAVEGAGALILFFRFLPEFGFGKALWYGVFHSISAFCNAGFDVLADTDVGGSLCRYATDPVVNFTIMALIIIGGIKRIAQVTEKLTPFMAIVYVLGSLSVLIYNYDQVWPAVVAIFGGVFSGTAATGGFLGATVALAFNRGVNRGLFSNEAGQGSAPIAHAAAKAEDPVSEGMVALLEPFIDTIVICALTGLVLVSSGVWHEKYQNQFQGADLVVLAGDYAESDAADRAEVGAHLLGEKTLPLFSGDLRVERGEIETEGITILHARSFAEAVQVKRDGQPFTGTLRVDQGKVLFPQAGDKAVYMEGRSLLHSAPLSTEAFKRGILGDWGQYVIPVSLLLFAFSTTIAWAYYGSRAITYLWGVRYVRYYQVIYVVAFFLASFTDTTIVWTLSGITVALMTLPNLIGILLLHKEVKACVRDYVRKMKLG